MTQVRWLRPASRAAAVLLVAGFGVVLLAPAAPGAVGDAHPGLIPSVIPSVTVTNVPAEPHFSVAPATLDFGGLEVGAGKVLKTFVTNDSFASTDIDLVNANPASTGPFSDQRYGCVEVTLGKPGGTCEFRYVFQPTSPGLFNAMFSIKIKYDGLGQQTLLVNMIGCGYEPGRSCTTQPTPTQSPAATARPTSKDVAGGPANPGGVGPAGNPLTPLPSPLPPGSTEAAHTALAADPSSSDGPNMTMLLLITAVAAAVGTVIGGVLIFRGRWLWSKLRGRT